MERKPSIHALFVALLVFVSHFKGLWKRCFSNEINSYEEKVSQGSFEDG